MKRLLGIRLLPGQIVPLAGLVVILLGTVLLLLPWATPPEVHLSFVDALFTSTSAVCVTGLIVLDTPQDFTLFGQTVILLLIQIGGLGYATIATLLLLALGRRLGMRDRMMIAEVMNTLDMAGLIRFVKTIIYMVILLEGAGAFFLTLRFMNHMELSTAIYFGIFHSVSAFNNAGFSLFSNSLIDYRGDWLVIGVVSLLIVIGGIGFIVFQDLLDNVQGRRFRLRTHTKFVVIVTFILLIGGTAGLWILEWHDPNSTIPISEHEQFLTSFFFSVSARTAGFNTFDVSLMRDASTYFLILLMIIGGSPGSAAGGIKTTTFGILCLFAWGILRNRGEVEVFRRRIPYDLVIRSAVIFFLGLGIIIFFTLVSTFIEGRPFLTLLFEVTSAFGTVGLSVGDGGVRSLSALFSDAGKVIIILDMLIGRFGPLMIGLFAIKTRAQIRYRYPKTRVVIG